MKLCRDLLQSEISGGISGTRATTDNKQEGRESGEVRWAAQPQGLHLYFNAEGPISSLLYVMLHCKISLGKEKVLLGGKCFLSS